MGLLVGAAVLLAGCSGDRGDQAERDLGADSAGQADPVQAAPSTAMRVRTDGDDLHGDGLFCDGSDYPVARISGAEPGEWIALTSPQPIEVADRVADDTGAHLLFWRCDANESGLTWELTATGLTSGRTVTFSIVGGGPDPVLAQQLTVASVDDRMICDDSERVVAALTNATPGETVDLTAVGEAAEPPEWEERANAIGTVRVHWRCDRDIEVDDATAWTVTAVGAESGRRIEFELVWQPVGPIEVEALDGPVICNRERNPVAVLHNLTPKARVDFTVTPDTDGKLRPGWADGNGDLDVYWQCNRVRAGTSWTITATDTGQFNGPGDDRAASFTVTGSALDDPTVYTPTEEPFRCDGETRPVGVLSSFLSGEYIDFASPQADAIRQGRADTEGTLPIRWQCDPDQVGTDWEITATGATSGYSVTFTITGAE